VDTRNKIVDAGNAAQAARAWRERGGRVAVVTGWFDVLQADDAREMAEVKHSTGPLLLVVVLVPPPEPVLSVRARAEMAAGFAMVDYVVTSDGGPALEAHLAAIEPDEVIRREAAHERRMRQLIEHVHGRQTGG
jgi:bifunctional ADP-heptose synthase (sugar kinase/adenylyltransferase)